MLYSSSSILSGILLTPEWNSQTISRLKISSSQGDLQPHYPRICLQVLQPSQQLKYQVYFFIRLFPSSQKENKYFNLNIFTLGGIETPFSNHTILTSFFFLLCIHVTHDPFKIVLTGYNITNSSMNYESLKGRIISYLSFQHQELSMCIS